MVKRGVNVLVFAGLLSAIGGCASGPSLQGAWRSKVDFTSGEFAALTDLEFLLVFNAGGTMTESSNYDGAPPVPPAYGVWRQSGPLSFEAVYCFYTTKVPPNGEQLAQTGWGPGGFGELTETIDLERDGRTFTSRISCRLFDGTGTQLPGSSGAGQGTAHATRIGFDTP